MPGKPKKISTVESEFNRQMNKLSRLMKAAEAAGVHIPKAYKPPKPKTVTQASVERVKRRVEDLSIYTGHISTPKAKLAPEERKALTRVTTKLRQYKTEEDIQKGTFSKERLLRLPYNQEYVKMSTEVERLKQRGVYIPDLFKPEIPKRVTKQSIARIKSLRKELEFYEQVMYKKPRDLSPEDQKRRERIRARIRYAQRKTFARHEGEAAPSTVPKSPPPSAVDLVLDNVMSMLAAWNVETDVPYPYLTHTKTRHHDILANILNGAVTRRGKEAVAKSLEDNAAEVLDSVNRILYVSSETLSPIWTEHHGDYLDSVMAYNSSIQADIATIAAIVNSEPLSAAESEALTDMMEDSDDYN